MRIFGALDSVLINLLDANMTVLVNAFEARSHLTLTVAMMTCLILIISVSFKIIALGGLVFTASSILAALLAIFYLRVLKECNLSQQRHLLNQGLLALYLFPIGVYLLVNLPAAEYMHDNPAYQIVFEDIPKKFFASTLAFVFSFYLPHIYFAKKGAAFFASPHKRLLLALWGGFAFFTVDFLLLFSDPHVYSFSLIYFDSLLVNLGLLSLAGCVYLVGHLYLKAEPSTRLKPPGPLYLSAPLYSYLISFSVSILLICLACEYRLVSFSNGLVLAASGLLFPLAIVASNLISELYGYRANLRLVIVLILTELAFDLLLMGTVMLPSPEFFNLNPFYCYIMPRRIPAATLALFVTFTGNAILLENLKYTSLGISRWMRILIANIFASSMLCLVNYSLLYGGVYPYEQIFNLALNNWTYKLGATLMGLPLSLWLYQLCHRQKAFDLNP